MGVQNFVAVLLLMEVPYLNEGSLQAHLTDASF